MPVPLPYHPGRPTAQTSPLARYLPPVPGGVLTAWLAEQHLPPNSWLLDPFGSSPGLPVEAARAGYRVLVAGNNPVARFLLELAACPPTEADLTAALAERFAGRGRLGSTCGLYTRPAPSAAARSKCRRSVGWRALRACTTARIAATAAPAAAGAAQALLARSAPGSRLERIAAPGTRIEPSPSSRNLPAPLAVCFHYPD
jgi:hypothetical protein